MLPYFIKSYKLNSTETQYNHISLKVDKLKNLVIAATLTNFATRETTTL